MMEATFVVKKEDLTTEWLTELRSQFADDGTITITASGPEKPHSEQEQRAIRQREAFKKLQEIQEKSPPPIIAADIDIYEIIDSMYWEGNH
jgi:hypothetical protein